MTLAPFDSRSLSREARCHGGAVDFGQKRPRIRPVAQEFDTDFNSLGDFLRGIDGSKQSRDRTSPSDGAAAAA
jgi:hypothetical protein